MKTTFINNFLDSIYDDKKNFAEVYGTEKLFDPKFMLIADTMNENKELLSDIILEALQNSQKQLIEKSSFKVDSLRREN